MKQGDKATFMLGLGIVKGEIIKINEQTVIVKLPSGKTIKRHIEKHNVETLNA